MSGILWLETLLKKANFAYVLISHDRVFLENVTTRMMEVSPRYPEGIFAVPGCYSDFLEAREAWLEAQHRQEKSLAGVVRREIEWLRRGPQARATKADYRVNEAKQKIGDLAELKKRNAISDTVEIGFASTGRRTRDLLVAQGLTKAMGGTPLFHHLDFTLGPGSRLGIVGNNGTGKSTLIRLLTGELDADEGTIKRAPELRVAVFDQKREQLDRGESLRRALAPNGDMVDLGDRKIHVVGYAARFLFAQDQLDTPVGELSGGEQARVLIATMVRNPADILLLDEPTNDLDIRSIEILEESLQGFPGAVVLITHDRYMLERLCPEMVGLHGKGQCGQYTDFLQWERGEVRANPPVRKVEKASGSKEKPKPQGGDHNLSREEQREFMRMEKMIEEAEAALAELQARLEEPDVMADTEQLQSVCEEVHAAQTRIDTLYARWEELETKRSGT
ncbi:MAG: ABC-F family ATP-binding cassette domain-containing protein [Planctomycetota bacterium]